MSSKYIIVADLQHLKIFNLKQDPLKRSSLELVEGSENIDAHLKLSEKVSDRKGNFQSAQGSGSGEDHNLALEEQRRRIKEIAQDLSHFLSTNSHQSWCFAAPKAINKLIVELLDANAKKSLTTNLSLDLTNTPSHELLEHFLKQ